MSDRTKQEKHFHATGNARRLVALAISIMVLALVLSPLASCQSSGKSGDTGEASISAKPGELLKSDDFAFIGIDGNWLYYRTLYCNASGGYTYFRMNSDGSGNTTLFSTEELGYLYDLTPVNDRLYYITDSPYRSPNEICSSPIDCSEKTVLTGGSNSFHSELNVAGEWIYFVRSDWTILPDGEEQYASGLYRMKLDGSEMTEIAAPDASPYPIYTQLLVAGSNLIYARDVGDPDVAIAMRDAQGSEETIISTISMDEYMYFGPIIYEYANGTVFYSHWTNLIFSLDTQAPYAKKTVLTGEDSDKFTVAFVDNGWVYYEKGWFKPEDVFWSELWRVRTDGTGAMRVVEADCAFYLAIDADYIYYMSTPLADAQDQFESTLCRIKKP